MPFSQYELTKHIDQSEKFTKEVSVGPEVMILQVCVQVVEEQLLLLPFFGLRDDPQVQVHLQSSDLARLPVLPQPSWNVEQNCLKTKINENLICCFATKTTK